MTNYIVFKISLFKIKNTRQWKIYNLYNTHDNTFKVIIMKRYVVNDRHEKNRVNLQS